MKRICAMLLLLLPVVAQAQTLDDRPRAGLIQNLSGLPATLPLIVQSDPGDDHLLTLISIETGKAALTAYVRGGEIFRLLAPPGNYRLRVQSGQSFDASAMVFDQPSRERLIEGPLRFLAGAARYHGQTIDLRQNDDGSDSPELRDFTLCQGLMPDTKSRRWDRKRLGLPQGPEPLTERDQPGTPRYGDNPYGEWRYDRYSRVCD